MSLLGELDTTTPRSEEQCRRFARRIDPWWRSVGVLVACGLALALVLLAFDSFAARLAGVWSFIVVEAYAVRAHLRWRHRRFKLERDLIRNGQVFDMVIVAHGVDNIVAFQMRHGGPTLVCGFDRDVELKPGATMHVLWSPPVSPVLACDDDGRVHVGHMHG